MRKKILISLTLSVLMILQLFIIPMQSFAKDDEIKTVQKSEGKKIGEHSEIFEFTNKNATREQKLKGFRFMSEGSNPTRTETISLDVKTNGLGSDSFKWDVFGNNKSFKLWIEVLYANEKDRKKVSEELEINSVGKKIIEVKTDSTKTVKKYFIRTNYDTDADRFKIQAIMEKGEFYFNDPVFDVQLDIFQVANTNIVYQYVDEYGKVTTENIPDESLLINKASIAGTEFNIKTSGSENLWQSKSLDEWDLMDSSIDLTLNATTINSNEIEYKLSKTYDVNKGGTITIQRQKPIVTPEDPNNPGEIPEGYGRLLLNADEKDPKTTKGTFTLANTNDKQRIIDVKAGTSYNNITVQERVKALGTPIPLTADNQKDTGKVFSNWAPTLDTLGNAASKVQKDLNAAYMPSDLNIDFDIEKNDDAKAPRHNDEVVKGKITSQTEGTNLEGAKVVIKDKEDKIIGITLANKDGSFVAGTRPLVAGEELQIVVTLSGVDTESAPVKKQVKLNPDDLNKIIPMADKVLSNFNGKTGIKKAQYEKLSEELKKGKALIDETTKKPVSTVTVDADGQKSLDDAYKAIKDAIETLTANSIPLINAPDYKEIFKGDTLDLTKDIKVSDADGDNDLVMDGGNKFTYKVTKDKVEVKNTSTINQTPGTYFVEYSAKDKSGATATHTMTLVVKKDVIEVPGEFPKPEDTPQGYVKVEFKPGDSGRLAGTTKFLVKKDSASNVLNAPEIVPNQNFKVKTNNWNPVIPATFIKDFETTAQYEYTGQDVVPQPGEDKPSVPTNFVKVEFKAGEQGIIANTETYKYWVDPAKKVTLTAPNVIANQGYKHTGWDKALTGQFDQATDITAQYKKTVIEGEDHPKKPGTDEPDTDYVKVNFVKGDHGTLTGTTTFWVLKNEQVSFNPPKVKANTNYMFKEWDPTVKESYTENQTHTATYSDDKNNNGIPDDQEQFDIAKTTSVEIIKNPDKMDYLVTTKDGKAKFDPNGLVIKLTDASGKSATYTAEDIAKEENKGKFTLSPAKDEEMGLTDGKDFTVTVTGADATEKPNAKADKKITVKLDADNNGKADVDETTDTPTATASNIGENPKETTVKGTAPKNSKVTIKYNDGTEEKTVTVTAEDDGSYKADISPKLPAKTEVTVTAKDGDKKESAPFKTIVFDDKNNNGKDDESEGFDITKADKIEMIYDPAKMDYLVTEENGTVVLETKGMLVKVTDKLGKVKTFTAEELAKDTTNFIVEPAEGTQIGLTNNNQPIKVKLKNEDATTKEVQTSRNLSVKLDKDGNGIPDDQEQFDIKKATKVEILSNPDKMDYLVNKKDGKAKFDTTGLVIKLTDASGKTATYTAEELKNLTDKITLNPVNGAELGLTDEGKNNTLDFTVTVNGAEASDKPSVTADKKITVKLDADNNGKADVDETTPEPTVIASNKGEGEKGKETPATKTTVEVKTEPNAKVTIEYTDAEGKEQKVEVDADDKGEVKHEINPVLKAGTEVKVTAKDGEKLPATKTANVFDDLDNDGKDDNAAGKTERPAAIASNKGNDPKFTTVTGKTETGATITVKVKVVENGNEVYKDATVGNFTIDQDGNYSLQATYDNKPLDHGSEILVYAQKAPKTISKPQTTTVFNDFNEDGKPDGGKVDLTDAKDIQVIAPNKMDYTNGEALNAEGLKAVIRDNKGGIEIFDYDVATGKFKNAEGKEVDGITANVSGDTAGLKDLALSTEKHNDKAIEVKVGNQTGVTTQKLKVNKLQTPTPTIVFAANQNTVGSDGQTVTQTAKNKTTVKFTVTNQPTTVYIKYQYNGQPVEETINIDSDNDKTKTVDLQNLLPVGTEVQVLAKDADKTISEAATAKVVRDANNDGNADDKTPVGKTTIDPIKAKSESITVKPADNATELVIKETDKSGNTPEGSTPITVTKDKDGNWKIDETPVEKNEDGKLIIPTKDKLKLDEYNVVEVDAKGDSETTTPSTSKEVVGEAADTTAPDMPVVDQPVDGDLDIKVKTPTDKDAKTITVEVELPAKPGEDPTKKTVVVEKDEDGNWKVGDTPVKEENGKLVIPVDTAVKTGDKVTVEVADDSGNSNKTQPKDVIARQQLPEPTIEPIKIGEKTVAGTAKDATTVDIYKKVGDNYELIKEGVGVNSDGTYNYPGTTEFKDGDVIRVVAKKDGWTPNNAETTVGVDTTALDKAIQDGKDALDKTNDGTPEDKALEKAIQDAEDLKKRDPAPTQKELNDAKDKIEKAIEAKQKTDAEREKLKDIIKEAEEETQKDGYKDKPGKDRRELEKAIKEGKASLENNTKIPESTTKIEKALEKIRKETLQVGLIDTKVGNQSITISTYPSFCKVKIYINDVFIEEIKTDGFGTYRYTLDEPIESGATIELKAHKDGFNDDSYWTKVN